MTAVTGTVGNDTIFGTGGDDIIDGGGGIDMISGGAGNDTVRISSAVTPGNTANSVIDGGAGYDVLDLSGIPGPGDRSDGISDAYVNNGTFALTQYNLTDLGYIYSKVALFSGFEEVHLGPGIFFFSVYGEKTGDPNSIPGWKIIGSEFVDGVGDSRGNDTIQTGAGNDEVLFHGGNDRVSLGDGDDLYRIETLSGYADHAVIDGGQGRDSIRIELDAATGGAAIDLLNGVGQIGTTNLVLTSFEAVSISDSYPFAPGDWHVTLAGTNGDDRLESFGPGEAILLGRDGDDLINYGVGFAPGQGSVIAYGGPGNDQIGGTAGADWINGGGHYAGDPAPADALDDGSDYIWGNDGNDHIFGNSQSASQGSADGPDWIDAGAGMDYVNGNGGNDYIIGGEGRDRLYGGAGDDLIYGDGDNVLAASDTGNDHINGNKGNDRLLGGSGDDEILGGQGNDILDGGDGVDTLSGNVGSDIFRTGLHLAGPLGITAYIPDLITDFQSGEDFIGTDHSIQSVLHPGGAIDYTAAFALAASVLPSVAPGAVWENAAAIQVGGDTYLFWDNSGQGPASGSQLQGIGADLVDSSYFH